MTEAPVAAILMPFLLFFTILIPEFAAYSNYKMSLNEVASYAIDLAEKNGGFVYTTSGGQTVDIRDAIDAKMEALNIVGENSELKNVEIYYTDNGGNPVQYNDPLAFIISAEYEFKSFKLIDNMKINGTVHDLEEVANGDISVRKSGVSQVYFR